MKSVRNSAGRRIVCLVFIALVAVPFVSRYFFGTAAAQSAEKPIVILLGPPSSGKSTQSDLIQKRYTSH